MPSSESLCQAWDISKESWSDACLAIRIASAMVLANVSVMPTICVRAGSGPVVVEWLHLFAEAIENRPFNRFQAGSTVNALTGGLDFSATLATGKKVTEPGLIEKCQGGILILPLSSPLDVDLASAVNNALDDQTACLGLIVINEGGDGDEFLPASLKDRLMFHLDLSHVRPNDAFEALEPQPFSDFQPALADQSGLEELCALSLSFGLSSLRPSRQMLQIASFHAGLAGRSTIGGEDISVAVRLGLLNRATVFPSDVEPEQSEETPPEKEPDEQSSSSSTDNNEKLPNDLDIESIIASLPSDLLDALKKSPNLTQAKQSSGRTGSKVVSYKRGRPLASVRGEFNGRSRLDLVATLRASAPWQALRRKQACNANKLQVRKRDFHFKRYAKPSETTSIFVVDASGSTAVNRLGEAKGAVEILLSESYSRRDYVALISMRGPEAELMLEPTRSLTRARRTLSGLKGGGGTPLAHGLQMAQLLASEEIRRGRSPNIIILTDGSANISLDGSPGRKKAIEDAMGMGSHFVTLECGVLVLDVSRVGAGQAEQLARAMDAEFIHMPFASSKNISDAVRLERL